MKRNMVNNSFEEEIQELKAKIEKLEKFVFFQKYFDKVKNLQNCFIVEMRRIVAQEMFSEGWSKSEIGKLICRHHSSVIHLLKMDPNQDAVNVVEPNYKTWIETNKYPYSVPESVPSYIHPKGYKTIVTCEIGNVNDLI